MMAVATTPATVPPAMAPVLDLTATAEADGEDAVAAVVEMAELVSLALAEVVEDGSVANVDGEASVEEIEEAGSVEDIDGASGIDVKLKADRNDSVQEEF